MLCALAAPLDEELDPVAIADGIVAHNRADVNYMDMPFQHASDPMLRSIYL